MKELTEPRILKKDIPQPRQCYFCGLIITAIDSVEIKDHVRLMHDPDVTQLMFGKPSDHQCAECRVVFRNEANLKEHVCGITNPSVLLSKKNGEQCPNCGLSFKTHIQFKLHYAKVHLQEKRFQCDQCPEKFYVNTHLKKHILHKHVRDGKKLKIPAMCDICGKMFTDKARMKIHRGIFHTGHLKKKENFKKCKICEAKLSTVSSLRKHSFEMHGVEVPWPYPCTYCDRGFERKPLLAKHLLKTHQITS